MCLVHFAFPPPLHLWKHSLGSNFANPYPNKTRLSTSKTCFIWISLQKEKKTTISSVKRCVKEVRGFLIHRWFKVNLVAAEIRAGERITHVGRVDPRSRSVIGVMVHNGQCEDAGRGLSSAAGYSVAAPTALCEERTAAVLEEDGFRRSLIISRKNVWIYRTGQTFGHTF